ncbi:MAG: toprim domain-containing protein, partial [Bacteroidota bacterium]|nr:toprim domain-containing protein [Bacteroidota bacterium]
VKAGLAGEKDNAIFSNKFYDRFRNRVIFPIHSVSGKVIAFGGRILDNRKDTAKYVNSPETAVYHKSKSLYGIHYAKNEIVRQDKCFLVEGYTDVISMHQAGVTNVVASSGTSLTNDQIRLVHRFTENITLIFDGDKAGLKAGLRGLDLVLKQDMNVRIIALPEGEDPDSFSKKMHTSEIKEYIEENEADFILFQIGLLKETDLADPIKKTKAIQSILKTISVIPYEIKRTNYIKETSRLLDYEERIIYSEINKLLGKEIQKQEKEEKQKQAREKRQTPEIPRYIDEKSPPEETELLRFLVKFGNNVYEKIDEETSISIAEYIIREVNSEGGFQHTVNQNIFKTYEEKLLNKETIDLSIFSNNEDDEIRNFASKMIREEPNLSPFWEKNGANIPDPNETYVKDIEKCVIDFKIAIVNIYIKKTSEELKNPNINFDEQKAILERAKGATGLKLELTKLRGGKNIFKI